MTHKVLGVDPSTHCGWAVVSRDGILETGTTHADDTIENRIRKFDDLATRLLDAVYIGDIDLVVIEDYVRMAKFVSSVSYEVGAIVRRAIVAEHIPMLEVSPTSLKKFVLGPKYGKGKGKLKGTKKHIMAGVKDLWGFDTKDDNQADALALAQMGLVYNGQTGLVPPDRHETVARLGTPLK